MVTSEPSGSPRALIRDELAANIRAARARKKLQQNDVVTGMHDRGFSEWHRQTVSRVEHGERRVQAEEVCALAEVLGTSAAALMAISRPDVT
jgi:transcriptional regulator with XRE-family HTH domain